MVIFCLLGGYREGLYGILVLDCCVRISVLSMGMERLEGVSLLGDVIFNDGL